MKAATIIEILVIWQNNPVTLKTADLGHIL
jgi:hypothetical protein